MTDEQLLQLTRETAQIGALTVERLEGVEGRLCTLEELARTSDGRLARLVEFEERRDRREEAAAKREQEQAQAAAAVDLEERRARGAWLRTTLGTMFSREVLGPLITVLAGLAAGAVGMRALPAVGVGIDPPDVVEPEVVP